MDLYIFKNGQNIGPLTPEQARTGLQSGQFVLSDKAITQSISDWTTLEEVLKLLDIRADFGYAPASVSSTNLLPSPLLGTSVSATSATSTSNIKPWDCLYAFGLVIVVGMLVGFTQSLTAQIPALGAFNSLFMWLSLLSLVGWIVGLVSPVTLGRLTRKFPAHNARYFENGVSRKQVTYVFGTACILLVALGAGTETKQIGEKRRLALTAQTPIADEVNQKHQQVTAESQGRAVQKNPQLAAQKRAEKVKESAAFMAETHALLEKTRNDLKAFDASDFGQEINRQAKKGRAAKNRTPKQETEEQVALQEEKPTVAQAFKPEITLTPNGILIKNNSKKKWESCWAYINFHWIWSNGYKASVQDLEPSESQEVAYSEFTENKGLSKNRFIDSGKTINKILLVVSINGVQKKYEMSVD